jgi:Fe2+/Zn2+ uptake regulation proteins
MVQTRMTKQRSIILEVLRSVKTHPTADELYTLVRERLPRISLGTVYRNLDILAASGDILRLDRAGEQKRFDGDISPHYHVRCNGCGRVGDLFMSIPLPDITRIQAENFDVQGVEVIFFGLCDHCRKKVEQ